MNIGIRLHDTAGTNLAEHLAAAREQGFTCVHIAMSKVIPGFMMSDAPALLTDELAAQVKAELDKNGQTCVLLGCYLNLCSPDLESHEKTVEIYKAHLRFAKKIGAKNLALSISGKNLLTFTDWVGWDPELGVGAGHSSRPVIRSYSFGIDLTF